MFDPQEPRERLPFDPLADKKQDRELPPLDLLPRIAGRAVKNFSLDTFRAIYDGAIQHGLTSEQDIAKVFGVETLSILQNRKSDPSPAVCRDILIFISSRDPSEATGEKKVWRHARPRQQEPTPGPS